MFARARALALVGATTLGGCSTPPASTAGAGGALVAEIGVDLPTTGADASVGVSTRNGATLAIENAAHDPKGGVGFAAIDLDDAVQGEHDPAQGAQNVRTFIADSAVLGMIGPYNSNVARAEIPLTNDAGLVQVSPATTSPSLTQGDTALELRRSHPNVVAFFRVCATDNAQGAATARYARRLLRSRAYVVDDDETYGLGIADVFARRFTSLGGLVVARDHLSKGQTDFKALLTRARALSPDVVFFGGTTSTGGGLLRKQMRDAGMSAIPFFGGDGIADPEFETVAGTAADGTFFTVAAPTIARLPAAAGFVAAYRARFGAPPGPYSANAYAAAGIEIAAIRAAYRAAHGWPTRAAVLARVAATRGFASPIGTIGFDAAGDLTAPVLSVYRVAGGRPQFVAQFPVRP